MKSMFAVSLQQGLETNYGIKISLQNIKRCNVGMVKQLEARKVEELKELSENLKESANRLSKFKFIIPSDAFAKLNKGKTGNPVYFLPPLEGIFASLEPLADKLNRPVIGLNWTKDLDQMTSMKEISGYYIDLLKTLHPKGDYDIVGYFSGGLIATQMLRMNASIDKTVIIDPSSELKIEKNMLSDDYILDQIINIFKAPQVVKDKIKRDLSLKEDVNSKLIAISDEIKDFVGKALVSRDLEDILINSFKRAKLFATHRYNMQNKFKEIKTDIERKYLEMKGKLLVIKPYNENIEKPEQFLEVFEDCYSVPGKV